MTFNLQSSGHKADVLSQVNGQITASYDQAPKGDDREDQKKRMEKIRDYLFNDLGGDFPDDSDVGLVLVGDGGKDYVTITDLRFSISRPRKAADEEAEPAPVKDKPAPSMPKAPDKGGVKEGKSTTEPELTEKEKAQVIADEKAAEKEFQKEQSTTGKF